MKQEVPQTTVPLFLRGEVRGTLSLLEGVNWCRFQFALFALVLIALSPYCLRGRPAKLLRARTPFD